MFRNKSDIKIEELNDKLDIAYKKIMELEKENEYLIEENSSKFKEARDIKIKFDALTDFVENLPEFQLPKIKISFDYYEGIINKKQTAIILDYELVMGNGGNYVILEFIRDDKNSCPNILIQVKSRTDHKIKIHDIGSSDMFSSQRKYELLGFTTLGLCKRDILFTYPDAKQLYFYEFVNVK